MLRYQIELNPQMNWCTYITLTENGAFNCNKPTSVRVNRILMLHLTTAFTFRVSFANEVDLLT